MASGAVHRMGIFPPWIAGKRGNVKLDTNSSSSLKCSAYSALALFTLYSGSNKGCRCTRRRGLLKHENSPWQLISTSKSNKRQTDFTLYRQTWAESQRWAFEKELFVYLDPLICRIKATALECVGFFVYERFGLEAMGNRGAERGSHLTHACEDKHNPPSLF